MSVFSADPSKADHFCTKVSQRPSSANRFSSSQLLMAGAWCLLPWQASKTSVSRPRASLLKWKRIAWRKHSLAFCRAPFFSWRFPIWTAKQLRHFERVGCGFHPARPCEILSRSLTPKLRSISSARVGNCTSWQPAERKKTAFQESMLFSLFLFLFVTTCYNIVHLKLGTSWDVMTRSASLATFSWSA